MIAFQFSVYQERVSLTTLYFLKRPFPSHSLCHCESIDVTQLIFFNKCFNPDKHSHRWTTWRSGIWQKTAGVIQHVVWSWHEPAGIRALTAHIVVWWNVEQRGNTLWTQWANHL